MSTKNQAPRHSLPPKPMVAAPPPSTAEDADRSLAESAVKNDRDHKMDWSSSHSNCAAWNGNALSATPPVPTPALTASSLSSSLHGEQSPSLGAPGHAHANRRYFDIPAMTSLPQANSYDDAPSLSSSGHHQSIGSQLTTGNAPSPYDGALASLSSAFGGLSMSAQQMRDSSRAVDPASARMPSSPLTNPSQPMLIPMQPTGAGVPLTSVVETLSSKGSKAAAEDPQTVADAYTLSQWGIGIGPGINPKVTASRNGTHCRGRSTANDPPIVNTGNSGPMCVQPGDWICTGCGFVNWRRREVCMRCFPHADGNEISRGIQGGEALARRLAAGLDTDTEEYRQSIQALCPDRERREFSPYMQSPAIHALPRNPVQAYGVAGQGRLDQQSANADVHPSSLLGIHLSSAEQQQWRQRTTNHHYPPNDQFAAFGYYSQPTMPDQVPCSSASSSSHQSRQQSQQKLLQQQHFDTDPNHASHPYKMYTPWSPIPALCDNSGRPRMHQRTSDIDIQATPNNAGRMSPLRSATYAGEDFTFSRATDRRSPPHVPGVRNVARPLNTGWSNIPDETGQDLPKNIWASAPKQAPMIPLDSEDVSRDKRAKPDPIGTRSSRSGSGTAGTSLTAGGTHLNLEFAGPKDDKHPSNAFVDYWISDSLIPLPSASANASGTTLASVPALALTDAKTTAESF